MRSLAVAGIIGVVFGFGCGVLTGRQFPAHHFERFGESRYLLDSATGKVCDPMRDPKANPIDEKDANGFTIVKPAYPPACEK